MAWAVTSESEYGRFFPRGNYHAYQERLETYYTNEMPAEEKTTFPTLTDYKYRVSEKFTKEIGVPRPHDPTLTPLKDHEWPTEFQTERKIRFIGSIVKTKNRVLAVDEHLKNLIERVEPSVHQFRPITFLQPDSKPFPATYFIMVIGQFRDSFVPKPETEDDLWAPITYLDENNVRVTTDSYSCYASGDESFADLAFSRSIIDGAHMWRERRLTGVDFYLSDTLRDAIRQTKLEVPPHFAVKEV